jgi:hypothetical protein
MQGIIVTPSSEVWACDLEKSQMVYMICLAQASR